MGMLSNVQPEPQWPSGTVRVGRIAIVPFCERDEYRLGELGVCRVKRYLQERGAFVFSTCDLSGRFGDKAPAIEGVTQRCVLPDLDVSFAGHSRIWAEVKTKTIASFTRVTGRLEHGIKLVHWLAYRRIQEITGNQVFLYIYQRDESMLLGSAIDELANPDFRPSSMLNTYTGKREPHVFFPYDFFRLRAQLPIDIDEPAIFSVQLKLSFELRSV